jgi:ParB family transcriptional regulator, chromosome partitioning protein
MSSSKDQALLAAERQKRLAQIQVAATGQGGPLSASPPAADPFRGRARLAAACEIAMERIIPDPEQPRQEFDGEALDQLAASIKMRGVLQPIRVRWEAAIDRYVVVVGERRWRAAQLAGLTTLPCVVATESASPEVILEDQLVENCLREGLRPLEQARAYQTLLARLGISQRALADRLSVSHGQISQCLELLKLPPAVQADVDSGAIPKSVGYQLSRIADPEQLAEAVAGTKAGSLSREQVRGRTARRGESRPEPVTFDLGDVTVTVKWKRAGTTAVQALRRAAKEASARETEAA